MNIRNVNIAKTYGADVPAQLLPNYFKTEHREARLAVLQDYATMLVSEFEMFYNLTPLQAGVYVTEYYNNEQEDAE